MAKYNVGDKVKVRSDLSSKHGATEFMRKMYGGKEVTISSTEPETLFGKLPGSYNIAEDPAPDCIKLIWNDDMFEEVESTEAVKPAKKNPLPEIEDGMIGKDVNGDLFVVVGDRLIYQKGTWDYTSDIEDGIVPLVELYPATCFNAVKEGKVDPIWTRSEPVEEVDHLEMLKTIIGKVEKMISEVEE